MLVGAGFGFGLGFGLGLGLGLDLGFGEVVGDRGALRDLEEDRLRDFGFIEGEGASLVGNGVGFFVGRDREGERDWVRGKDVKRVPQTLEGVDTDRTLVLARSRRLGGANTSRFTEAHLEFRNTTLIPNPYSIPRPVPGPTNSIINDIATAVIASRGGPRVGRRDGRSSGLRRLVTAIPKPKNTPTNIFARGMYGTQRHGRHRRYHLSFTVCKKYGKYA
eukprot:1338199-Amorphochlora_amoeboformis.AAC.1